LARVAARQMSFADLELLRQGVRLEPLLQAIGDFLDKQPALVEQVRRAASGSRTTVAMASPRYRCCAHWF
jgi:hypothetical protein